MGITGVFKRGQKQDKFLTLLIEQSEITVEGLLLLEKWFKKESVQDEKQLEKISRKEFEADDVRRILIDELHNTFVTPLDREDIFQLSLDIDDMLDYAYTAVEEMQILEIEPDTYLVEMIIKIRQAAEELLLAIQRLNSNPRVSAEHARRAKKLENEVEFTYRKAIGDLFKKANDFEPLMEMLRRREVYRHLSNMADRANKAADVVGMIVMKII